MTRSPDGAEHWKCAECRNPYPVDLPACPGCGAAERTRCQAQGCDEIECGDLATGIFHERGHTFDGCDEHRERPYVRDGAPRLLHGVGTDARGDVVASVVDSDGAPAFAVAVRVDDRRTEAGARILALELLGRLGVDTAAAR